MSKNDTGKVRLPAIPPVDLKDPGANRWAQAITEWVRVRSGINSNPLERVVTVRDLQDGLSGVSGVFRSRPPEAGEVQLSLGNGLFANISIQQFSALIRQTPLYQSLLQSLNDPSRFDGLAQEVRAVLERSILNEAATRGADIRRVETKIQEQDRSLAMAVEEITTSLRDAASGVRQVQVAQVTADEARAEQITQVEARLNIEVKDSDKLPPPPAAAYANLGALVKAVPVGDTSKYYRIANPSPDSDPKTDDRELLYVWDGKGYIDAGVGSTAKLEQRMTAVANRTKGLESRYTVKVTAGGAVAGFGLAATDNNGATDSAFIIAADKFALVRPDYDGGLGSIPDPDTVPFGVYIDGEGMAHLYINGSITIGRAGEALDGLVRVVDSVKPDLSEPPVPSTVSAKGGIANIFIAVGDLTYKQGHGHGVTILYGAQGQNPTFEQAREVARFEGSTYGFPTEPATTWHFWAKFVTQDGITSPKPSVRFSATTGEDITKLMELLDGKISQSELSTFLKEKIDLIDGGPSLEGSVDARIEAAVAPDLTPPPTPTSVSAVGGISNVVITISGSLSYTQGHGHKTTALYGAKGSNPTFQQATLLAEFEGAVFSYATEPATTWHFWVKFVTQDGVYSTNPSSRFSATTGQDVSKMLEALSGKITDSQLYSDLKSRINLIDGPTTLKNSVANRVLDEALARGAAIKSEQDARQSADNSLAQQIATLTSAVESKDSELASAIQNEATARANADTAEAAARQTLAARVTNTETGLTKANAAITEEKTARASADDALTSSITKLGATLNTGLASLNAAITDEKTARANADSAEAAARQTLQSTVTTNNNTLTAAIQTEANTRANQTGELYAKYGIKLDVNGYITGWSMNNNGQSGNMVVLADKFSIGTPGVTNITPFVVNTTNQVINGVSVPPGAYIDAAYIKNGSITNAKIGNAAIDDAKISSLSAAKITSGAIDVGRYIQSANYNAANGSGWRIDGYGNADFRNAVIRGSVDAYTGKIGGVLIDTDRIRSSGMNSFTSGSGFWFGSDGRVQIGNTNSGSRLVFDGSSLDILLRSGAGAAVSLGGFVDGIKAQYTVRIDSEGYVAGYGLYNSGATSQFIVSAGAFAVGTPGTGNIYPFKVLTTPAVVDGKTIPAGTYIDGAYIQGGTVNGAAIKGGTIEGTKLINVSANKITGAALASTSWIESANYVAGSSGWKINGTGAAEFSGVTVRGAVYATSGQFVGTLLGGSATDYAVGEGFYSGYSSGYKWRVGKPSGARIQWNGNRIEVYNEFNQLTFSSGGISASQVSGLGALATLSSINAANVSGLGALALQNTIGANQVTGLGPLATAQFVNWNTHLVNVPAFGNFAYLSSITSANISSYIASTAIGTAYIADGAITSAKIGSLEVGTVNIANEAVTIPRSYYYKPSTQLAGTGAYTCVIDYTFTVSAVTALQLSLTARHGYGSYASDGTVAHSFKVYIGTYPAPANYPDSDDTTKPYVLESGGSLPSDYVAINHIWDGNSGRAKLAAGSYTIRVWWRGASASIRLASASLILTGTYK